MSVSRSSSAEDIQKSESSTSIDINLENDVFLDEDTEEVKAYIENNTYLNKYNSNTEPTLIDTLSNPGELLISSVKTRRQEQEFKETIITNSTSSFEFGFKNVERVFPEKVELPATKTLPEWLSHSLYILSPARFDFDYTQQKDMESINRTFTINHLFDGLPIVQKFDLKGNSDKVNYMSQMLSRKAERKIHEHHGIPDNITGLWSNNTNQSALSRILIQPLKMNNKKITSDNSIIGDNIIADFTSKASKGTIATVNNIGNIRILNDDLKAEKVMNYIDINPGFKTSYSSPHPKIDPQTGKMVNVVSEITLTSTKFKVITFDNMTSNVIATINEKISPIHSFAITENYIIIISFPYKLKKAGLNYFTGDSLLSSFEFDHEGLTNFYVISKKTNSHIATFTTDPCFGLHMINSYETSKTIWIDFAIYSSDRIVQDLTLENLRKPKNLILPSSKIVRFRLDLNEMDILNQDSENHKEDSLLQASFAHFSKEISIELPTINPRNVGQNYKYAYGVSLPFSDSTPGKYYDRIKKINIETQQSLTWSENHCYPSEPLFISNSSDVHAPEDDGVLVSLVYNGSKNESFLLILNAKDMTEISRVVLPVPFSPSFGHSVAIKH